LYCKVKYGSSGGESSANNMNASSASPIHVAIITDGNGRWGTVRGLPRSAGHRAGAENLRRVLRAAPELGISTLTLYAFSANNWQRPQSEVNILMQLLHDYLIVETPRCVERGIRVSVIGRRDRISPALREAAESAESATANGERLHLRIAVDYSSREMIYRAACRFYKVTDVSRESFEALLGEVTHDEARQVDLVIRTGGALRLSDYLLWESAYAELYFTPKLWPEFSDEDLRVAIADFHSRLRTYGQVPDQVAEQFPEAIAS
jgi:undecaprenyl diphosphate synthase